MKVKELIVIVVGMIIGGLLGEFGFGGHWLVGAFLGLLLASLANDIIRVASEPVPFLPEKDPDPEGRQLGLEFSKQEYQFNHDFAGLPLSSKMPLDELPTLAWAEKVGVRSLKMLDNNIHLHHGKEGEKYKAPVLEGSSEKHNQKLDNYAKEFAKKLTNLKKPEMGKEIFDEIIDYIHNSHHSKGADKTEWNKEKPEWLPGPKHLEKEYSDGQIEDPDYTKGIKPYKDIFQTIPLPETAHKNHFLEDTFFTRMRVAGPNPLMIQKVTFGHWDKWITEEQFSQVPHFEEDSLNKAIKGGRVFLCDYHHLSQIEPGNFPISQKYIYTPKALFAISEESATKGTLLPVAILSKRKEDQEGLLFFPPKEGIDWKWEFAKTMVQIADGNYHELISHLGLTHLVTEPFVLSTYRNLSKRHPLSILLRPHFEGTIFINHSATTGLIAPGGGVDQLLSGKIESSQAVAAESVLNCSFNDRILQTELANRGFDAHEKLLDYPYRDDALPIWNAIHKWVSNYLALYYKTPDSLAQDVELANWYNELVSEKGGKVKGFGEDGKIKTLAYLQKAVTQVIFNVSAQHAAVNFPQDSIMSFTPAMPLGGYAELLDANQEVKSKDWLKILPPLSMAVKQYSLGYLLGGIYHTKLGHYNLGHFRDQQVFPLLKSFQQELKEIEQEIKARNTKRVAYEFLIPSTIPQSINI